MINNSKILVTGRVRYIGSHIVKQLLETTNYNITIVDDLALICQSAYKWEKKTNMVRVKTQYSEALNAES